MKRIIMARLRFLGRNVKQARKLPHDEFIKLVTLLPQYNTSEHGNTAIDRALLELLFQLKQQYQHAATTLQPLLGEYKTLVAVMSQGKNHSSAVLQRYEDVLTCLSTSKAQADMLVMGMKQIKLYLGLPQRAAVRHFVEESKTLFTAMQRGFVEFYEPIVGVVNGNVGS